MAIANGQATKGGLHLAPLAIKSRATFSLQQNALVMNDRTNTIIGWILASGGLALGSSIVASTYFDGGSYETGYVIEVEGAGAAADAGPSLIELINSGTPEAGEAVFARCAACHTIAPDGPAGIGPNLYGVLGTQIASNAPGFNYSSALASVGGEWSFENMDAWLESPRGFANGTTMSFAGLGNAEDRANLVLYMLANGGGPAIPEVVAEEAPAEGEAEEAPADDEAVEQEAATEDQAAAE